MRISVGQFGPFGRVEDNLAVVGRLATRAAAEGAALLVLPEETMFTFREVEGDFAAAVDAGWDRFRTGLAAAAREHGLAIVAGGYEPSGTDRPYNTLVAVDADGTETGTYRKLHLYDAFAHRESDLITPGDRAPAPLELAGLCVGLQTCYDLRFPEVSRALAVAGADLLAVPAAWFAGEHKVMHWQTLLRARAVENTVWVAAADTCSAATVGHSAILDPLALTAAELTEEAEAVATAEVSVQRTAEVRRTVPVLAGRRTDLLAPPAPDAGR
ncbi:nitrilase-related carbon-nitrogen hydrolase [Micrococcus sp.]|uniref:nitrilase-related carbon-nitrogen hydrolase n=1 Tax=Micrococcus sp. TaxID=1271 RepID=UPI002A911EF7|nr:nitrilase-related carbon-nitrogen hydrolase [Micrococcus sp.]MDY6055990.1 nitrilase-related carbon-nitrogen hydrolase [Micrococcus sp.]